jgi:HAD superfamily hydrolase (TIGR01450 family)
LTVLCDLDGVVYRGGRVLHGAGEALARLAEAGVRTIFITNNSTRTPENAAAKISSLAGVAVAPDDVVTSSLATVGLLGPADGPVYIVGEDGVSDAVARAGLSVTEKGDEARSVVVGLTRSLSYEMLGEAMKALMAGARFIATNNDHTFPTETGVMPGAGAIVAALEAASGRTPVVAGKPHAPMREFVRSMGVTRAWVIGDRLDTDIALASDEEDWSSILVLTGVTTRSEVAVGGADHVVKDLPAAVDLVLAARQQS